MLLAHTNVIKGPPADLLLTSAAINKTGTNYQIISGELLVAQTREY